MAVLLIGCECDQVVSETLHRFAAGKDLPKGITGKFGKSHDFPFGTGIVAKVHSTSHQDWPVRMLGLAFLQTGHSAIDVPHAVDFTMAESVFVATVEEKHQLPLMEGRGGIRKPGYIVFAARRIPFVDIPNSLFITDVSALGPKPGRTLIRALIEHFVFPAEDLPRLVDGGKGRLPIGLAEQLTDITPI